MTKTLDRGSSIAAKRKGPCWWLLKWLRSFIDRCVERRRTLKGSWEVMDMPDCGWRAQEELKSTMALEIANEVNKQILSDMITWLKADPPADISMRGDGKLTSAPIREING